MGTPLILEFTTKFVLQVLGGAGAIWGSSELLEFRTSKYQQSQKIWRWIAIVMGLVFFAWWCRQLLAAVVRQKVRRQRRRRNKDDNDGAAKESSPLLTA